MKPNFCWTWSAKHFQGRGQSVPAVSWTFCLLEDLVRNHILSLQALSIITFLSKGLIFNKIVFFFYCHLYTLEEEHSYDGSARSLETRTRNEVKWTTCTSRLFSFIYQNVKIRAMEIYYQQNTVLWWRIIFVHYIILMFMARIFFFFYHIIFKFSWLL